MQFVLVKAIQHKYILLFTSELSKKLRIFGCFKVFKCFTADLARAERVSLPGMSSLIKNSKIETSCAVFC